MVETEIRYCTTSDGVTIAYAEGGEGTPFLSVAAALSNAEVEWRDWEWYRIMAARRRLIRFDNRGSGLSQRDVEDFSLEAMGRDIDAVSNALGLDSFVLHAELWATPTAIAYAAWRPERVSHLVLFGAFARTEDLYQIPRVQSLFSMLDQGDWELFTDTMALTQMGWQLADVAHMLGEYSRSCVTLGQAQRLFRGFRAHDVTALLKDVQTPTLVLHPRGAQYPTLGMAQKLAAGIRSAQLRVLESDSYWSNEMEPQLLAALDDFLGDGGRAGASDILPHVQRVSRARPPLATILFTDLVGHTEMMHRLGDARGREVLREHERITRQTLRHHGGAEVKTMGDGFLASFGSVTGALECAIALQRAFAAWNETGGAEAPQLLVRVGLNAGEPIEEDGDLFGSTVILAARIAARAEAGEILVPDTVRGLLSGKPFVFADHGEFVPKGFDDAVRLFEVRWRE